MALPILAVSEFSFSAKLPIRTGSSWEYESVFCRLLKLAYWHGLNGRELTSVFGAEITLPRELLEQPQKRLQRKLAHYLGNANSTLSLAYPPTGLSWFNVLTGQLRGCKQCYRQGFHSALYQLTFLECCPIHNEPLILGCLECRFAEAYCITPTLSRNGYRCSHCKRMIMNFDAIPATDFVSLLPRLSGWRRFLTRGIKNRARTLYVPEQRENWFAALREWNVHYGEIPILPANPIFPILPFPPDYSTDGLHPPFSVFNGTVSHYYRMRRMFRQLAYTHDRKQCPPLLQSCQSWWPAASACCTRNYAYVLWRGAWERSLAFGLTPAFLSRKQPPISIELWMALLPPAETEESKLMALAKCGHEMAMSFSRCMALSEWMQQKGGFLLSPLVFQLIIPQICIRFYR